MFKSASLWFVIFLLLISGGVVAQDNSDEAPNYAYLFNFNTDSSLLQDPTVRSAILLGINDQFINDLIQSEAGGSFLKPSSDSDPSLSYDPDLANALLDEIGIVDTDNDGIREWDGVRLSFILTASPDDETGQLTALLIQDDLEDLSIEVDLIFQDFNSVTLEATGFTPDLFITRQQFGTCLVSPEQSNGQDRYTYVDSEDIDTQSANAKTDLRNPMGLESIGIDQNDLNSLLDLASDSSSAVYIAIFDHFQAPDGLEVTSHGSKVEQVYRQVFEAVLNETNLTASDIYIDQLPVELLESGGVTTVEMLFSNFRARVLGLLNDFPDLTVIVNISGALVPCTDLELNFSYEQFYREWLSGSYTNAEAVYYSNNDAFEVGAISPPYTGVLNSPLYYHLEASNERSISLIDLQDLFQRAETSINSSPGSINATATATLVETVTTLYNQTDYDIFFTASAGNFGETWTQPFYPAALPFFISVSAYPSSATMADGSTIQFRANRGEAIAQGGWFDLEIDPYRDEMRPRYTIGTSFALPLFNTALIANTLSGDISSSCQRFGSIPNQYISQLHLANADFATWSANIGC